VSLPITDTRSQFRPLCNEIVALLRALRADDWERQTLARQWHVRHVVAHLCDTALRRLSFHRDRYRPPSAPHGTSERDLTIFVNDLNATWIHVAERFSPRVLTDWYVTPSPGDATLIIEVTGPASGLWTLRPVGQGWDIDEGGTPAPAATISMADETAWRLLFNALAPDEARSQIALRGDMDLARPFLNARAVIV